MHSWHWLFQSCSPDVAVTSGAFDFTKLGLTGSGAAGANHQDQDGQGVASSLPLCISAPTAQHLLCIIVCPPIVVYALFGKVVFSLPGCS